MEINDQGAKQNNSGVLPNKRLLIGTVLQGKYLIQGVLGEGGFGITYVAFDNILHMRVAIKEYFPTSLAFRDVDGSPEGNHVWFANEGNKESFDYGMRKYEKEGHAMAELSGCSGIVSVLNFFFENNTAYMVMEYLEGCTLKDFLASRNGSMDYGEVLRMFEPVIASLIAVHNAGFIHRDISPDNIMLTNEGQLKIIDFGDVRDMSSDEVSKMIVLKRGYAPPEQYQVNGNIGPWTDVYALCATMLYMCTGRKPEESIERIGNSEHISLRELGISADARFEQIINYGMEPFVSRRCNNMQELYNCLYSDKRLNRKKGTGIVPSVIIGMIAALFAVGVIAFIYIGIMRSDSGNSDEPVSIGENTAVAGTDEMDEGEDVILPHSETEAETEGYQVIPETTDEKEFTYEESEDGLIITSVNGSLREVRVPATIDGKAVYSVSGLNPNVVSVVLSDGIRSIDRNAMKNYYYLTSISIPDSVESIDSTAFINCKSLEEVLLGKGNRNFYIEGNILYASGGEKIVEFKR